MRGGKREGAGRPRGSRDGSPVKRELRKAIQDKIVEETRAAGMLPLDIMASLMREYWETGSADAKEKAGYWADRCAPYFHAKLSNVQHSGDADNPLGVAIMTAVPRPDADTNDDDQRPQTH